MDPCYSLYNRCALGSPLGHPRSIYSQRGRPMLKRKISLMLTLVMLAALAVPALAQDTKQPSAAQAAQQQKMKDCNAQATAKNLKGDERKTFMSSCLSANPTASVTPKMTQQE